MPKKNQPGELKLRSIKRKQVQQILAMTASFAVLMSGCSSNKSQVTRRSTQNPNPASSNPASNAEQEAVFYENAEQCRTDIKKQNDEYQVLFQAYETGQLSTKPTAPEMAAENCDAQIQAAQEAHEANAPVYDSRNDCVNAGYRCEATPVGYYRRGYRPVFGGTYFYYGSPDYVYVYRGSTRYRVYRPRTVYYSRDAGRVVTPSGRSFSRSRPGRVKLPKAINRNTTRSTPSNKGSTTRTTRPKSKPARGAVRGRGRKGFGSTYKGTGRGGK
ncbi:MAG: hypothetical protein AAFQ23_10165 [Cyanobacteria bacterium J06623_1]